MNILLTGATGFIGRALVLRLLRDRHRVSAWVRDPAKARATIGPDCTLVERDGLHAAVAAADGIINLAGEAISPTFPHLLRGRWTAKRKAELTASRVGTTRALVDAMHATGSKPVLVSASAVGFYGDRGDDLLEDGAAPGTGFAAELCREWEAAAHAADGVAARVVVARLGVVLGREGGALAQLLPLTRAGLGGPIAGGAQWVPWIHLDDVVDGLVHALTSSALAGAFNLVAPAPVRQRELADALGDALHRPAFVPAPGFAMRALLGEAATVLTASQRVVPTALLASGFAFRFGELADALADITGAAGLELRKVTDDEVPDSDYTRARHPRYVLIARTELAAPIEQVFPFFAAAENLGVLTPPAMAMSIDTPGPIEMHPQTTIDYHLKILGVPATWRTVIERWQPPTSAANRDAVFVDAQERGPYRAWWHEHHFRADGDRTIMEDRVYYAPPLGVLGALANTLMIAGQLRRIFGYRAAMIRHRFGA